MPGTVSDDNSIERADIISSFIINYLSCPVIPDLIDERKVISPVGSCKTIRAHYYRFLIYYID
jgi:hypothetical protein